MAVDQSRCGLGCLRKKLHTRLKKCNGRRGIPRTDGQDDVFII